MNIDCTLNALTIPGISGLAPPFGTKKPSGGSVSALEASANSQLPFRVMRPLLVSENSTTTQIQANVVFEFVTGGITLTLGNGTYSGCRVSVINSATTDATAAFGQTTITVRAKEAVHLEWVNNTWMVVDDYSDAMGFIALSLDHAALAMREIQKTNRQRIQSGVALIKNRGVISGCAVVKSTTAVRSLSLNTGSVFFNGVEMFCPAFINTVLVPINNSGEAQTCYAYIYLDANGAIRFYITPFGEVVPDNGLQLYRIGVPAVNTETSDPNLTSVTLTDVRRMEAGYPVQLNSIAYTSVALAYTMINNEYEVVTEILEMKGGSGQRAMVYPGDKAANGFRIYVDGTLDAVKVRWTAIKTDL
jgi:hypothetical protein